MRTSLSTALVLLGGEPIEVTNRLDLPDTDLIVAADSGLDQARVLGLEVDVAVGDFDSVSDEGLRWAIDSGSEIHRYPKEKSAVDFELALELVMKRGLSTVVVVGGEGARLDHQLSNALIMASPRFAALTISALGSDGSRLYVVRGQRPFTGVTGEYVTLMAVHGDAIDVTTTGLRYPLSGERLEAGSSRGVSNEMLRTEAAVDVGRGTVLVVLPGN